MAAHVTDNKNFPIVKVGNAIQLSAPRQFKSNLKPPSSFEVAKKIQLTTNILEKADSVTEFREQSSQTLSPIHVQEVNANKDKHLCGAYEIEHASDPLKDIETSTFGYNIARDVRKLRGDEIYIGRKPPKEKSQSVDATPSLSSSLDDLSNQLKQANQEKSKLKFELRNNQLKYESLVSDLYKERSTSDHLCSKYFEEISILKQELDKANAALRDEKAVFLEKSSKLEGLVSAKDKEVYTLKNKLDSIMRNRIVDLDNLNQTHKREIAMLTDSLKGEIERLEMELQIMARNYENEKVKNNERKAESKSQRQKVKALSEEIDNLKSSLNLSTDKEKKLREEFEDMKQKAETDMLLVEKVSEERILKLQQSLQQDLNDRESQLYQALEKLREREQALLQAEENVSRLKQFIASENAKKSKSQYEGRIQALQGQVKDLEELSSSQAITISLLNVRLVSLNNILEIQDQEFQKSTITLDGQKAEALLTKWRNKVYALLVQLKSKDISEKNEERIGDLEIKKLTKCRDDLEYQIKILDNELKEKRAESDLQSNKARELEKKLATQRQEKKVLLEKLESNERLTSSLADITKTNFKQYMELSKRVSDAYALLPVYSQRISYACKRLQVIKAFALKMQQPDTEETDSLEEPETVHLQAQLQKEVDTLTNERSMLLRKIENADKTREEQLFDLEQQHKEHLTAYASTVQQLRTQLEGEAARKDELLQELLATKHQLNDLEEDFETLRHDRTLEKAAVLKEAEGKLQSEMNGLQGKLLKVQNELSDTQREHAKAVASLHQHQRQSEWEIKLLQDKIAEERTESAREMNHLTAQLRVMEKERNVMAGMVGPTLEDRRRRVPKDTADEENPNEGNDKLQDVGSQNRLAAGELEKQTHPTTQESSGVSTRDFASLIDEFRVLSNVLLQDSGPTEETK